MARMIKKQDECVKTVGVSLRDDTRDIDSPSLVYSAIIMFYY